MQATRFRFLTPMLLGLCLVGLAACAPYATPTRTKGQIPPVGFVTVTDDGPHGAP
jgi:hypothetical protein